MIGSHNASSSLVRICAIRLSDISFFLACWEFKHCVKAFVLCPPRAKAAEKRIALAGLTSSLQAKTTEVRCFPQAERFASAIVIC